MLEDGSWQLSSIDGGPPDAVPALRQGDRLIGWRRDSRAVFVQRGFDVPAHVEQVDLTTGTRSVVRQLARTALARSRVLSHRLEG